MAAAPHPYILCVGLTPAVQDIRVLGSIAMGEVNRCASVDRSPAGKGTNVAHVLRTLGHAPLLTGFVGGESGNLYEAQIDRLGIRTAFVRTAAPTRVCVTLIERDTGRITELVEESALPSAREWRAFHLTFGKLLRHARLVTLTGALMPGAPPALYRDLAALAAKRRVPVLIDSQKAPLLQTLPQRPLLAKLNVHELENTLAARLASPTAILAGARRLMNKGARHVLVTNGGDGAWLVTPEAAWHYPAPKVKVCNPIGSGDAVTAGVALGLVRGQPIAEAIRLGLACGSANVLTPKPGLVRPADVRRLLSKIHPCPA